jgi:hypothetical protein
MRRFRRPFRNCAGSAHYLRTICELISAKSAAPGCNPSKCCQGKIKAGEADTPLWSTRIYLDVANPYRLGLGKSRSQKRRLRVKRRPALRTIYLYGTCQ